MSPLLIVPIGSQYLPALPALANRVQSIFGVSVMIAPVGKVDPAPAYNVSRNQYYSTQLILSLLEAFPRYDGKLLGVTSLDLYVPVLTFVFGEAQLEGRCAVISLHRLNDELYGFPPNPHLLEERMQKEAVHELGHTFGFTHCVNYDCVMHSSTAVEEVDIRPIEFCVECGRLLKAKLGENLRPSSRAR